MTMAGSLGLMGPSLQIAGRETTNGRGDALVFQYCSYRKLVTRLDGAASPIASLLRSFFGTSMKQWMVRWISVTLFFVPFALYLLSEWKELAQRPPGLDVGIIVVAAALGGLILNAGLNLRGEKRVETVRVAQKFVVVVVLMLIFLPSIHVVEIMGGINLNSFEPDKTASWSRGVFFWIAAASFFSSIILFIFALVDLAFALKGIHAPEYASWGNDGSA